MDDPLWDPTANEPDNDGYTLAQKKHVIDGVARISKERAVTSAEYEQLRREALALAP